MNGVIANTCKTWKVVQKYQQHTQSPFVDVRNGFWQLNIAQKRCQKLEMTQKQLSVYRTGTGQIPALWEETTDEIAMANDVQPMVGKAGHTARLQQKQHLSKENNNNVNMVG